MISLRHLSIIVVVVAAVAIFYGPYLSPSWSIAPWFDTIYLTGPMFCDISRSIGVHVQPLMNWSTFEAIDYNAHIAPYYPFYFFGLLDFCSAASAAKASDIIAVLHVAIFFATMASLIRATGQGVPAAIVGAGIAVTLPNTHSLMGWPTFIAAAAWLPLAIEGLVRLYYRQQYALGTTLLAIGTGAMLTAGPGTNIFSALVFTGIVMTACLSPRLLDRSDSGRGSMLRIGVSLAVAATATAVLTLASTINLYSHLVEFIRWTRTGSVIGSAHADPSEILSEQQSWRTLPQLILPVGAPLVGSFFLGPVAVALAILGAVRGWHNAIIRAFALMALLVVAIVFLCPSALVMLWAYIPGLSHTRHLSLLGTPLSMAVAVLAAHGFQSFTTGQLQNWRLTLVTGAAATFVIVLLAYDLVSNSQVRSSYSTNLLIALMGITAILVVLLPGFPNDLWRRLGAIALLLLNFTFLYGSLIFPAGTPAIVTTPLWQSLEQAFQYIKTSDPQPGLIAVDSSVGEDGLSYMQAGSISTYDDLPTFSHYTSPRLYWKFQHEISLVGTKNFAPFGGKYLLSMVEQPTVLGRQVFQAGPVRVYELKGVHPLVELLCPGAEALGGFDKDVTGRPHGELPLLAGPQATASVAIIDDNSKSVCSDGSGKTDVQIVRSDNAVHFTVPAGPQRLLVVNLPPYASWRLKVAGHDVPLFNLQEHRIVAVLPPSLSGSASLAYQPDAYFWKLGVTEAGWFAIILVLIWQVVGRRKNGSEVFKAPFDHAIQADK